MVRIVYFVTMTVLVAITYECAADEPKQEPVELRDAPPVEEVKSITATWFDDGYKSFVRNWNVPQKYWKSTLELVKECKQQKDREQSVGLKSISSIHLRIITTDGRNLLLVSDDKTGSLRAFPSKGCKDSFLFAENAGPVLRDRLKVLFRKASEEDSTGSPIEKVP